MVASAVFLKALTTLVTTNTIDIDGGSYSMMLIGPNELTAGDLETFESRQDIITDGSEINVGSGTGYTDDNGSTIVVLGSAGDLTTFEDTGTDKLEVQLATGQELNFALLAPNPVQTVVGAVIYEDSGATASDDKLLCWLKLNAATVTNDNNFIITFSGGVVFDFDQTFA